VSRRLPKNWHTLSLGVLWERLNDPRRRPTPQVTIEAIMYAVRTRGLDALKEREVKKRLACCDPAAREQINARIERLLKKERQHELAE
jgi:hypothetical protein